MVGRIEGQRYRLDGNERVVPGPSHGRSFFRIHIRRRRAQVRDCFLRGVSGHGLLLAASLSSACASMLTPWKVAAKLADRDAAFLARRPPSAGLFHMGARGPGRYCNQYGCSTYDGPYDFIHG